MTTLLCLVILGLVFLIYAVYVGDSSDMTDKPAEQDNKIHFTQDDIIYKDGQYQENEFSEDWKDFEYQYEEDHKHRK